MKKKKIGILVGSAALVGTIFSSNVFADSKKQLEQIVMEHEQKIIAIEQILKNGIPSGDKELSDGTKQDLLKEITPHIENSLWDYKPSPPIKLLNYTETKIVYKDGKNVVQIYFEGGYDWTYGGWDWDWDNLEGLSNNAAHGFAHGIPNIINNLETLYGVNLDLEIYDNGERVTKFIR